MRSRTIRLGIFISTLVIAAIIIFQLIWLKKVYNFEQRQFDHSIVQAIRGYYDDVHEVPDPGILLSDQVTRLNSLTYLVRIDRPAHYDSMAFFMKRELEEENIYTDCYLGAYDNIKKKYVFRAYLPPTATAESKTLSLPETPQPYYHLTLYFPKRRQYILSLMNFWLISSALLLIVLVLFGASLYYFYRQKFLNEIQKDFVNNFTHEFKTPVSIINLAAEVLETAEIIKKPERLSRYAAIVSYQGKYLQQQIERLLQYAYSETNFLHLNKQRLNFQQVIQESVNNLQPLIEEKKGLIEFNFQENNTYLFADHGYLLTVFTNVIENGLKYAKDPKIILHSFMEENSWIVLSVKDNGYGIEGKYLHKIFQKFYRVPTGEQVPARGFGLGLTFVKKIIDAHGGRIHVESVPGSGSNFIIRLPVG